MTETTPALRDLISAVDGIVNFVTDDPNAAIVIRNYDGVFLYVNDVWKQRYKVDPLGKTIPELHILSEEEGTRSIIEDDTVKQTGSLVTVDTYHINDVPVKMTVVRVLVHYKGEDYMIGTLYNIPPGLQNSPQLQQPYGEFLAWRLQRLDQPA